MWKTIRIVLLLSVLLYVGVDTWRDKNKNWDQPTFVLLHLVNADGRPQTQHYMNHITLAQLSEASTFLQKNAESYRHSATPFYFQLGREIKQLPPKVPEGSILQTIWWSLKFRFYAWKNHQSVDGHPSVTLYLDFYDPETTHELKHSTALQKGRIGIVNLFASDRQQAQNSIVLAHELLHAFGATDKYDLTNGQPVYPMGYANPNQKPLYPQRQAEIMAGYIPISQQRSKMPDRLSQVILSPLTAKEVGWIQEK